jgi:hypothetical protein
MSITTTPYFRPTAISGCALWFDGTDSSTITLSSGSLTQWNDKSGNGRNLTAVSGYANATVSSAFQNGLNVFNFSGNGLYRTAGGAVVYPQDCYIVLALKSTTAHVDVLGMGDTGNDNFNSLTFGEYSASRWHNGSSGFGRTPNCVSSTTETSTSFLLMQWSIANNNFLLRRNGLQLVQTASYTYGFSNPSTSVFQIGFRHTDRSQANFSGYIGEIIVFNSQLGTTQQQQVESYLAQKWGLTGSLPGGHPSLRTIIYRAPRAITLTMTPFFTGFTPRQIPGLGLWLDSTDSSTISFSSGSNVSQWRDKSGSSNHFSLTSGTTTTILDNGKTVINFPSGAIMTSANQITFTTSSAFYIVSRLTTTNSIVMLLGFTNLANGGGSGGDFSIRFVSSALHGTIAQGNGQDFANRTYYVNGSFDPSFGSNVYLNVYSIIGTVAPLIGGTSFLTLSSNFMSRFFIGYIAEFLYYPAGVTSTQRQQIESYLAQKWGLDSSLPGGHLHLTQPAGARTALSLANSKFSFTPIFSYILKYTYTGSNQSFVVPSGITSVNVYMWGAGGGAGLGGGGGAGCYVQGVLPVIPGETLTIVVGQGGGNKQRSFGKTYGGGGQGGGPDNGRSDTPASQGGGRSAIVRSSTDLVTAAAGGGGRGARGGRGRLVTGENGTGVVTGGSQSAGGTNNGAIYSGGNANQDNSAGGGAGYYGGGGGGQDQAGGGGSCLTSNLSLLTGESTFGTESSNGVLAPQTSSPYYNSDVAFGATSSYGYNYGSGGNGLVVISFASKSTVASLTYSRLILSAWFGSVAYRFGLDVTTVVNNAFGGNPSNTITLNVATLTNPQIGTTKFTYIVYMFNGIQKFSSPYAEGTVLTFSSLI